MQPFLLLKTLAFLVGVMALIYLCFQLYKKKLGARSSAERIVLIERRAIDQRTTVSLVRVDAREMIIVAQQNAIAIQIMPAASPPTHDANIATTSSLPSLGSLGNGTKAPFSKNGFRQN